MIVDSCLCVHKYKFSNMFDICAGNCEFEDDTCGWSNTGNLDWVFGTLNYGETGGPLTPSHLMFVTPTDDLVGKHAILTSPNLKPDVNCVSFW